MGFLESLGNVAVGWFLVVLIVVSILITVGSILFLFEVETPAMYVGSALAILFAVGSLLYWTQEWVEPSHDYNIN